MQTERELLLFDDQYLERRENLERGLGQPTPVPEGTYRDPDLAPSWGYPSGFVDAESGHWRGLYQTQLPRRYAPTIGSLTGQVIRLEAELFNGRRYALRGALRPATPSGVRAWTATGATPAALLEA